MPERRGESARMSMFVVANHAGNPLTRQSHTGIFIYANNAPIGWLSKQQCTFESSTFGNESVAKRVGIDKLETLTCKVRMMGIKVNGLANIYCDNQPNNLSSQ